MWLIFNYNCLWSIFQALLGKSTTGVYGVVKSTGQELSHLPFAFFSSTLIC